MSDLRTWDAWRNVHQPYELTWWKKALASGHPGLPENYADVKLFVDPRGDVIDIGSGPRPMFNPCAVIDPLAAEYIRIAPRAWWRRVISYAQPAEHVVPGLKGDTIVCWNCLDHAIGWRDILRNMLSYGRKGARFFVATDFFEPFDGHPGFDRADFEEEVAKLFSVVERREPFGRQLALSMVAKDAEEEER